MCGRGGGARAGECTSGDNPPPLPTLPAVILRFELAPADNTRLARVCGSLDVHLREIEAALGVKLSRRDAEFRVDGPKAAAERARSLMEALYERARRPLPAETLQLALVEAKAPTPAEAGPAADDALVLRTPIRGKPHTRNIYTARLIHSH